MTSRALNRQSSLATVLLCLFASLFPPFASAQVRTGTPPFGSFAGGPDTINLGNLNVHLPIHVLNKPGRGTNFTYDLNYDSSVWYPVTSGGTTSWHLLTGWTTASPATMGYATYQTTGPYHCRFFQETQWITESYYRLDNWVYTDSLGTAHAMIGSIQDGGAPDCGPSDSAILTTNDGSGYQLSVPQEIVYNTSGVVADLNFGSQMGTFKDRNGNQITQGSGGVFTDTLGTTALTVTGSGTPSSPYVLSYTAPSGASAQYIISYVAYTVKTNFGCSGISEYAATVTNLVDKVTLPDGSYYQFTYEPTPGYSGDVTARVASIRLPTGGTTSFTYTAGGLTGSAVGSNDPIVCADGSAAGLTRQTPDGTWTYARSQVSGNQSQTKVTTPVGDDTVIYFQKDSSTSYPTSNFYETARFVYQGASSSNVILRNLTTCYNGNASACPTATVSTPITQRTIFDQYGSNGLQSKHNYLYNSAGGLTEQDDYDYGSGSPGGLLRQILITYASLGNITTFPQQVTVKNVSGAVVSQTNYNYDETTPIATSGIAQHGAVYSSRGNLTSVNYPVSGLRSHFTYYDTGSPNTSQDVNGATTTYNYSSNTADCQMAFPTSISEPLNMSRSMTWNCTGAVSTSVTDENSQVTSITYGDPYFWRPASESFPDGGQTSWTYNSQTSLTTTTKMNSSQNIVSTVLLDGLGRTSQTQLNSDPQGVDYSVVTYDALGRPFKAYNPTRCNPPTTNCGESTWGYTTSLYDALGRVTQVTLQDGSVATASYTNNTVTATDPAGKKRQSTFDALGRLTQVTEDPGGLNYVTTYSYDALGNLTNVIQNGGRQRTYGYDALSRLTSESNPESGTTSYKYDSDSNCASPNSSTGDLVSRTDARSIRTCLQYDVLHRITQKNYSDGTPTATYYYDLATPWGSPYGGSYKGRLNEADTTSAGHYVASTIFVYDPMGRVTTNGLCTAVNCGLTGFHTSFSYDVAGDLTSYATAENGITFSYQYNTAARPTTVTSSLVDANHPGTLASGLTYMPASAYTQLTLGNGYLESRGYNPRLQPTEIKATNGSGFVRYDFTYGYGSSGSNNGNLMSWNSTGWDFVFNRSYSYDALNHLATLNQSSGNATSCSSTFSLSWNYDAWGNRTDQNVTGGTCNAFHASVNSQNQLSGSPYQYDAAGNMINDGNHTYYYDAEERLVQVDGTFSNCSTATACYFYDALGQRTQKTAGSAITQYVHDLGGQVILETDGNGNGNPTADYIYLSGNLVAEYANSTTYFAQDDHLGSTRIFTDPGGNGIQSWDYLPYGELLQGVSTTTHKFTGLERDSETSLDHTWFRQYSSQFGRWMHPDPAGLAAVDPTNPQSWNRYAYVFNSPLGYVDPLGLQCMGSGWGGSRACPDPDNPYPGGGGCSLDGCGNGLDGTGGGTGCYLNGSPVGCNTLGPLLSNPSGATVPCPPNVDCTSPGTQVVDGPNGAVWQKWVTYQAWTTGDYQDGTAVIHVDPAHWQTIGTVGLAYSFTGIYDAVVGLGPAISIYWIPSTHELIIAPGIGGTVGHNLSVGTLVGPNPSAVLPGWGLGAGFNVTPWRGLQATGNKSGILTGNSFGIPGFSVTLTFGFVIKL